MQKYPTGIGIGILLLLAVFAVLVLYGERVFAGLSQNTSGWAWSSNIGWISFNSLDCDADGNGLSDGAPLGCPVTGTPISDYGVQVNPTSGELSGYAWSSGVGWISFNRADTGTPPEAPYNGSESFIACVDFLDAGQLCDNADNNKVYGWARALSYGGGWDGWISLRGGADNAIAVTDNWTGSNGIPWNASKWTTSKSGGASIADIQNNEGRLYFASTAGAFARAISTMAAAEDSEVLVKWRQDNNAAQGHFRMHLRASGVWDNDGEATSSYYVHKKTSGPTVTLYKRTGGSTVSLGSFTYVNNTSAHWFRFQVIGSNLKVKAWADGTGEPGAWNLEVSDMSITGAGVHQVSFVREGSSNKMFLDDHVLTSFPSGISYGVAWNGSDAFQGWAWGGDVAGWISFNCLDIADCTKSYKVTSSLAAQANQPPVAAISCVSPCEGYSNGGLILTNASTDPNGSGDIVQSEWDIVGWGASPDATCGGLCNYTTQSMSLGTYQAELRVKDAAGVWSVPSASQSFIIKQGITANFTCSYSSGGPFVDCSTIFPAVMRKVYFLDQSTPSEGATSIVSWAWTFEDGSPSTGAASTDFTRFQSSGLKEVTLIVTDNLGRQATKQVTISVNIGGSIFPRWEEISPF